MSGMIAWIHRSVAGSFAGPVHTPAMGPASTARTTSHSMRYILISFQLALFTTTVLAQSGPGQVAQRIGDLHGSGGTFQPVTLFAEASRTAATDALWDRTIADAEVLQLQLAGAAALLLEGPALVAFELPFWNGTVILDVERVSIATDDFSVVQASSGAPVVVSPGIHFRGVQRGEPGSVVSISVFGNEVMALISTNEGNLELGRLEGAAEGVHVLYRSADLFDKSGPACSTEDDGLPYATDLLEPGYPKTVKCVRFYWEVNYDIFQGKGSVANATSYVTGLFNQSATLYANDGISVLLQEVFVWDVPSPYTGTTTSALLTQFGDYRTSFNGDLAHLLGYVGNGGVAWLNGLCNSQARYKMAYSDVNSTFQNVPVYSWSVEVVTHEQGHLMGSKHTHACAWNGNNTAIDGCGPAAGYTEGACAAGPVPSSAVGGTIMSYCHLIGAGINFNNGFGPQPKTLITNNVNGAACLTACVAPPVCGVPTGLSTSSITSTSASLTWAAVTGATSYTLQWTPTTATIFNTVTGLTTTTHTLSGLAPNTAHHFQVLAVCASGSSTYSSLTAFTTMGGSCSDVYEPNGTNSTAVVVPVNSILSGKIGADGDIDWYRFSNTTTQRNIKVSLTNLPANYQLRLYRSNTLLATSANTGTTSEQIIYNTSTVATNYKVKVNGASGAFSATQCYTLTVQIGQSPFSMQGMEGGDTEPMVEDDVISIYPNPASDVVNIVLPASEVPSTIDVLDATGRVVDSFGSGAIDVTTRLTFDMSDKPEGMYLVRVMQGDESTLHRLVVAH